MSRVETENEKLPWLSVCYCGW